MKKIIGTRCEICSNRVLFEGKYYCTVSFCNFFSDATYCDDYYYDNSSCGNCKRVNDCPYQSQEIPLCYGEV